MSDARNDDQAARDEALDPRRSFIVQAPAGSGKTGLLTQRYLRLLACVEAPEEIVAITFTRKAAGEMRERIVKALEQAASETPPTAPHDRCTWELARAARARDLEMEWELAEHPARLRIQTMDSLNAEFTRQMPLLSGFGMQPGIAARPEPLYLEAAQRTLQLLESDDASCSEASANLLRHLDNDLPRTAALLADMLSRRDQWLRHTGVGSDEHRRLALEQAFRDEIESQLRAARAALPERFRDELVALARHAGMYLRVHDKPSAICVCANLAEFPVADVDQLPIWRGLAELLLTANGSWRKSVDARIGFAPGSDEKTRFTEVLSVLREDAELAFRLARVRRLPEPCFPDEQWRVLDALLTLLPRAAAELGVLFAERGETDYAEVALRALRALGTPGAPTDLALTLDYRIRHLLVDEFQDTSFNQFALLECLTAGWQAGDGRTLFLVGDPMQSIYRFREAEVSLFLRARELGIGGVPLTPLTLSRNFRSQPGLVTWFNAAFSEIFPPHADVLSGAVSYSPCQAAADLPATPDAVQVYPEFEKSPEQEAQRVIELIREARARQHKVAVLVRNRNHLLALMPALRRATLRFRAVELERLDRRPVVRDLMALTRALLHPGDRTAWLAVLRAPWCGLTLNDLHALLAGDTATPLAVLTQDAARCGALSQDGAMRLQRLREILLDAIARRRRGSLRQQVEQVWFRLAGPATLLSREELDDAEAFLSLLESQEQGGTLAEPEALEAALAQLFAQADPQADEGLQLMTMHKAKGLEFDVVILPGLGSSGGRSERPLLIHLERIRTQAEPALLLAPLNARGSDQDRLYELVRELRAEQETYEQQRLLYVAATRARWQLHLLGYTRYIQKEGARELLSPPRNTLLASLWPALENNYRRALLSHIPQAPEDVAPPAHLRLRRMPMHWQAPVSAPDIALREVGALASEYPEHVEFDWAGDTLRHIGSVVHRLLQRIADDAPETWNTERLTACAAQVRGWLHAAGVPEQELDDALRDVQAAAQRSLADPTGHMILMARGPEAHSEYALSRFEQGRLVTGVIDRCFVDNDGVRWIVDYKTSRHQGGDLDAFLAREAVRYREQLQGYAQLMRLREDRPVKAGLYFPLLGRFHAVDV